MYQFNFIRTIMNFAQPYSIIKETNITFVKGREVPSGIKEVPAYMSLQPMSAKILKMLETGDWDQAEYVAFQYSTDNLPINKDTMETKHGTLKCIEINNWTDYGIYVSGWIRENAYQDESVVAE